MKQHLYLKDTLSGTLHKIIPSNNNNSLTLYVCGITPYDNAHLGHGRCYVTFDILLRLLQFIDYNVLYCRNITDIDDKLINKSKDLYRNGERFIEIAEHFYGLFKDNMKKLGCLNPDKEPRVTQVIPQIIAFIEKLIEKGHAYTVDGDVYFDVSTYCSYGCLAHRKIEEQVCGARVSINEIKRNPLDFALWKSTEEKPYWQSPWGNGRPGWHIECSVMSQICCGNTIDIHGGGMDLIFPHHENERAQSESHNGTTFVKTWVHCAFIQVNQEKMSKSLHNFVTLQDVFDKYDAMVMRYFLASHHYRSPVDFSWDALESAQKAYKKLIRLFEPFEEKTFENWSDPIYEKALHFLLQDINVSGFLGVIFENSEIISNSPQLASSLKNLLKNVLGLSCQNLIEKEENHNDEIKILLEERDEARKNNNWKRADEIRDILNQKGIKINDKKIS